MNKYIIRRLTIDDIKEMEKARAFQEKENGNGASLKYIKAYEEVLKKLFNENRIIGLGAFINDKLISLACFNLIDFGYKKKIPYLCAVWTNPKYRGKGISNQINDKLFVLIENYDIEDFALLTLEGNEAAYNLYKKLGYEKVDGEMSFLADIPKNSECTSQIQGKGNIKKEKFYINGVLTMVITFAEAHFFAHPLNLNGKTTRIVNIDLFKNNFTKKDLYECFQNFFHNHRFCKFNIDKITDKKELKEYILEFETVDINNNIKKIMPALNVMKKEIHQFDKNKKI